MKVLLTGSNGFLGSNLAHALVARGDNVIALKRHSSNLDSLKDIQSKISFINLEDGLASLFTMHPDIDVILHTATSYGHSGESLTETLKVNVMYPLELMEKYSCPFINTDTFFCKAPDSYAYLAGYTYSKRIFHQCGKITSQTKNQLFINVRLEHLYGPKDNDKKFTISIIKQMLNNVAEIKLTPGEQLRDFIFIDDAVAAYLKILESKDVMAARGTVEFELGSGKPATIREFVEISHQQLNSKSELKFGALPYRDSEIMKSIADLSELKKLGWESSTSLEEGIKKIVMSLKERSI
jgi:CDP-paratose synthetase